MRIITGTLKGRKVFTNSNYDYRPTTGKMREAMFSILTSGRFINTDGEHLLQGAKVADICAGTGILGFEAYSRGASKVCFVDRNHDHLIKIGETACNFKAEADIEIIAADALRLPHAANPFDIVFIDAPYQAKATGRVLQSLQQNHWLAPSSVIVVEMDSRHDLPANEALELLENRKFGDSRLVIWQVV